MKIVIVGCGKVGRKIANDLVGEKHDVVVVDKDSNIVNEVSSSLDVLGVVGEAVSTETLTEADIENADMLLAVTSSDEANMLCCLFARKINNSLKTIARVRNPIYSKEVKIVKDDLGLSLIINPEIATAREINRLLRFPTAMKVENFSRGRVELVTFTVHKDNILVGKQVKDISKELKHNIIFSGIERKEEAIIPNGSTYIEENDVVSIVGRTNEITDFFNNMGLIKNRIKSCMIVGGSRIAYYLSKHLIRNNVDVTIVEKELKRCEELSELLPKANIIFGDASSNNVLIEEGVNSADAFVSLTNFDEENILLSLYAKKFSNSQVITKINHVDYNSVIQSLDIGTTIDPKEITSDSIITYVRASLNASGSFVDAVYRIMNNKAEVISFIVAKESKIIDVPFEKLDIKDNLIVGSIVRNDEIITPSGKDCIKMGDQVLIVTTHVGLKDIEEIVK